MYGTATISLTQAKFYSKLPRTTKQRIFLWRAFVGLLINLNSVLHVLNGKMDEQI